jgi:alkylation response protein AidB-like acyl-CoA dehydrogenase
MPRERAALSHGRRHLLSGWLRRGRLRHRAWRTRLLHRDGEQQGGARQQEPLRDNAVVQSGLAQAEVNIRAARGFVLQSMADIWKDLAAGSSITVDQRITVRLAASHAIHKAREAVDFAYHAAGATSIFDNHPLERRFRDIHTVTQQLQGQLKHFETVGAWIMGADTDLTYV